MKPMMSDPATGTRTTSQPSVLARRGYERDVPALEEGEVRDQADQPEQRQGDPGTQEPDPDCRRGHRHELPVRREVAEVVRAVVLEPAERPRHLLPESTPNHVDPRAPHPARARGRLARRHPIADARAVGAPGTKASSVRRSPGPTEA